MSTTHHRARPHRTSEGTASARALNKSLTPDPYLLNTQPRKAPPKLRLIKTCEPGLACGFGTCSLTPECTGKCRYRQADEALRSHYGRQHTQRQDMPPLKPRTPADQRARALAWRVVVAVALSTVALAGLSLTWIYHP